MPAEGDLDFCAGIAGLAAVQLGWCGPRYVGSGTEFAFFAALDGQGNRRGLRVPRRKIYRTANNLGVTAASLQQQELLLTRWAGRHGLPVAVVETIVTVDGYPVLLAELHDDDGSPVASAEVGRLVAALHAAPPPTASLVAQRGRPVTQLVPLRLRQRHGALRGHVPSLRDLPTERWLAAQLTRTPPRLVVNHLDIRRQNILAVQGRPTALIDWANALIADPLLELARIVEYAQLPENGLEADELLAGYAGAGSDVDTDSLSWTIFRLDAAVMLAVVFATVAPDPQRLQMFVGRIHDLRERL